ncbi:hypothetical protein C1H46_004199 [Malus baccata]|uniref:Uncharacterized protein n=1 Tax=Malus baccata TaxID=106549 RepID=A0A540NGR1_MALBA|nr:hypothetical protein C1H46_004199 [Malus baccata]
MGGSNLPQFCMKPQTQFWVDKLKPFLGHYPTTILPKNEFSGCSNATFHFLELDELARVRLAARVCEGEKGGRKGMKRVEG